MKAITFVGPQEVEMRQVPKPEIPEGWALIKVSHAGICGSDLTIFSGHHPRAKAPLIMEIDQDIFLSEGDHGYISPHKKNPGEWNEERDYYYPIPTDDRSLTGGALTQNPGWNDGLDF